MGVIEKNGGPDLQKSAMTELFPLPVSSKRGGPPTSLRWCRAQCVRESAVSSHRLDYAFYLKDDAQSDIAGSAVTSRRAAPRRRSSIITDHETWFFCFFFLHSVTSTCRSYREDSNFHWNILGTFRLFVVFLRLSMSSYCISVYYIGLQLFTYDTNFIHRMFCRSDWHSSFIHPPGPLVPRLALSHRLLEKTSSPFVRQNTRLLIFNF